MKAMMSVLLVCWAALVIGAAEKPAKPEARIAELRATAKAHAVNYGKFHNGWWNEYVEGQSKEEMAAHRAKYLAALDELVKLLPDDLALRTEYGQALLHAGRSADALLQYRAGMEIFRKSRGAERDAAFCWLGAANCQWAAGDREGALATLKDMIAHKFRTPARNDVDPASVASHAYEFAQPTDYDEQKFPVFTDMKPFPTPREAAYGEVFGPKTYAVSVKGLAADDVRVKLLKTKFGRIGLMESAEPSAFRVEIDATDPLPECAKLKDFRRKEAYALEVTPRGAKIRASGPQGALWGVVSLIQLTDAKTGRMRAAKILDWPETERRGMLAECTTRQIEPMLFSKANSITFQECAPGMWNHLTPLAKHCVDTMAKRCNAFGIETYCSISWAPMWDTMPITNARALGQLAEICEFFASSGMGVYFPYDDGRFNGEGYKRDRAKAGSAAAVDGKFVTKLYRQVKAKYPDFRMIFCPPFYWGPDSGHGYPEDREKYLKAMGEDLDPEIRMYWTGPMVKSHDKKKYQVEWYAKLTKRRPYVFQNGAWPHGLLGYGTDPVDFGGWHYEGFYDDIAGYHLNCMTPVVDVSIATLQNCLWNPKAFDAVGSARAAANWLIGEGAYDLVEPGRQALAYFDKYDREVTVEILSEDPKDLQAKVDVARACWKKACEKYPNWTKYAQFYGTIGINSAQRLADAARKPPDLLKGYEKDMRAAESNAVREAGYDKAKGDLLFNAVQLSGSPYLGPYVGREGDEVRGGRRLCRFLRGAQTGRNAVSFGFTCDPFPPSGDYELILCALDDELPGSCTVKIAVNGTEVYRGEKPYEKDLYTLNRYVLPTAALMRNNRVTVSVETPGSNAAGTPWFLINYALLRKTNAK